MSSSTAPATHDDMWTVGAIAVLAFICADVAHEVIGHGVGLLLAGGRSGVLTTTRLIAQQPLSDLGYRLFDLGGPAGNLSFAGLSFVAQRGLHRADPHLRLLLWLAMAFSLFWGFGYLISCGVFGRGDWVALVRGVGPVWLWRTVLLAAGLVLYHSSMRLVASELHWIVRTSDPNRGRRLHGLALMSYVAGGAIACAGAWLDPRGHVEMWNSGALTSFVAGLGLLGALRLFTRSADQPRLADGLVSRSRLWIVVAAAAAAVLHARTWPWRAGLPLDATEPNCQPRFRTLRASPPQGQPTQRPGCITIKPSDRAASASRLS